MSDVLADAGQQDTVGCEMWVKEGKVEEKFTGLFSWVAGSVECRRRKTVQVAVCICKKV